MTVTAHGWTPDPLDDRDAFGPEGGGLTHRDFSPEEARSLVRCIEDAALLVEARRLAPLIDDLTDVCPYCRYPEPGHGRDDDCPLCDLLDLLTEDGA